jgi:hypothetical protein
VAGHDLNNLTDLCIAAKEKGLDSRQVGGVAVEMGSANKMQRMGVVYYSASGVEITDEAKPDPSLPKDRVDVAAKLYGKFGLSNLLINSLVATDPESSDGRASFLTFLIQLLGQES